MKRKDVDEINDEFFDFSLSSPAMKIRRLDAELAQPTIDEEDMVNPLLFEQSMESRSSVPENEERAIVLYNPNNNSQSIQSPPSISISPASDFLLGFKNPVLWSNQSNTPKPLVNECLAVVPWAPSYSGHTRITDVEDRGAQISDMMDADADVMDVEDDYNAQQIAKAEQDHATNVRQGFNQRQQHCIIQQPPNNLSTPITWFGRC